MFYLKLLINIYTRIILFIMDIFGYGDSAGDTINNNNTNQNSNIVIQPIQDEHDHEEIHEQEIKVDDHIINLPDPATTEYEFLNYFKNQITIHDIKFIDHFGNELAIFYKQHSNQSIQFYRIGDTWSS